MNYAFGLEIIKVLTEGFDYAQPPSVGQFFTNGSHLPLPLFLPIPGALTYNMEFTGGIPVQKKFILIQFWQLCTASALHCWEPFVLLRVSGPF